MNKLLLGFGLALVPFALSGCGSNCSTYCEYVVSCFECEEDDAQEKCEEACENAYDGLSDTEQETADACLECLDEELGGECSDTEDFADALEDCDNDCFDDDLEDFYEDWGDDFELGDDCGGGNVCEAAADICGSTNEGECSGANQCAAQCIVDAGSCTIDCTTGFENALCLCVMDCV